MLNICLIFVAFQAACNFRCDILVQNHMILLQGEWRLYAHQKATKIKRVFRKLLCSSCMYKRSDYQEKMQWSPTWWLSTKSHLVFFFNGKTAISIGRKKPRVAQVVIAKSAGLPDYHAHKKYLILPRQIPHKVNPIS